MSPFFACEAVFLGGFHEHVARNAECVKRERIATKVANRSGASSRGDLAELDRPARNSMVLNAPPGISFHREEELGEHAGALSVSELPTTPPPVGRRGWGSRGAFRRG